ncbi:MAG: hypothetical protein M3R54_11955 [Chloroflexota bacterium]|nr:hypothetical protein [Chloroflexota bacterium]
MIDRKMLLEPSFAANPPVKLNVPAKTLGLVLAILGAIGAVFGLLGILALLGLSAAVVAFAGIFVLAIIGTIVGWIGTILSAWGGYQMYQEKREGKATVIYGLVLNVIGSLISTLGGSGGLSSWLIGALISFAIYYLVIISRFPGEPPLAATPTPKS